MSSRIVTRFAPSPTGFLHIGGARTALFNWLYARHTGGQMLLRIEDTDRLRSTDEAVEAIKSGLKWLGLDWDGEPISQHERAPRHRQIAEQLVEAGKAYYCYASPQDLEEMREQARLQGKPPRYNGLWRDRKQSEAPIGVTPVIRIKSPQQGETIVHDQVQGEIHFPNKDLDDFIILRSDGTPTYMHAVVVDDHDMEVTHIIRGDDHLTNAARQIVIYKALGWDIPSMAHIPLIHGADGAKLSKRHGALGVEAYREMGFFPEALRNYLVRLGWSHGDDEIITTDEMISWFDIRDVNKGAARFDFKKLEALNGHYMRQTDDEELLRRITELLPYLPQAHQFISKLDDRRRKQWLMAMPGLKERAKTLIELIDSSFFIFADRPLMLDEQACQVMTDEAKSILKNLYPTLENISIWSADQIGDAIRNFAEKNSLKLGTIAQPLRVALTGRTISPGVFEVMETLGQDESLGRISDQIV